MISSLSWGNQCRLRRSSSFTFICREPMIAGAANTESQKVRERAVMKITDCGDLSHPVSARLDQTWLTQDFQLLHARI